MGKKQSNATTGEPKKQKQQKAPPAPELPFHEQLGKQLSEKFMTIIEQHDRTLPRCFEEQKPQYAQRVRRCSDENSLKEVIYSTTDIATAVSKMSLVREGEHKKAPKQKTNFVLDDLNSTQIIEQLLSHYGRMTHMGVRDHSYEFWLNPSRTAVISYRLCGKVAVISGDPVCPVWQYQDVLKEFGKWCKSHGYQYAINGASKEMAVVAKEVGWATITIAKERCLNVQSNPVLTGSEGKRIRTQCKQLMKAGTQLGIYSPQHQRDFSIERTIAQIYEDWRAERNNTTGPQAYVTVFDMFALSRLMTFIYSFDSQGTITGFSALRQLKAGYHIDPCITISAAPRGTVDLLLIASMALLREAGIDRLALGVEPLDEIGEVTGMSRTLETLTRKSHKLVTAELPLGGKKGFNDRFRPDDNLEEPLFLVYPNSPSVRQQVAMAHFSNVQLHKALKARYHREVDTKLKGYWRRRHDGRIVEGNADVDVVVAQTVTVAA
jgi:lysylphosphatidylglycerol synthetase-like protein (DUF2156 family)